MHELGTRLCTWYTVWVHGCVPGRVPRGQKVYGVLKIIAQVHELGTRAGYTVVYLVVVSAREISTLKTSILMWDLDFGQNTKVIGIILKYLCVKFGNIPTSFDQPNLP